MIEKLLGVVQIVLGVMLIIHNYRYNDNESDYFLNYWKAYLCGVGFIVIGFLMAIGYIADIF